MGKNILPVQEINLTSTNYTIEVIVIEREMPKLTAKKAIPCQRFLLQDAQGTKIQAAIFGANIATFEGSLKMYHTYSITKPIVSKTPEAFQFSDTGYQLTINKATPVEEIDIPGLSMESINYHFTPINHLTQLNTDEQSIDMVFAVVRTNPKRVVKNTFVADVQIVDQSLQPTILSLWDQFAEYDLKYMEESAKTVSVVVAMRLKISTFYGLSLATKPSTTFLFNPIIPEAMALQSWCDANVHKLKELPQLHTQQQDALAIKEVPLTMLTNIEDLPPTITEAQLFNIQGIIQGTDFNQAFYYLACSICKKATSAYGDEQVWCNSCKQKVNLLPRLKFNVQMTDSTGSKDATIFSEAAQVLYEVSDADIDLNTSTLTQLALEKLAKPTNCTVTVKARMYSYRDVNELKFNIHKVDPAEIQDEPKLLLMDSTTQTDKAKMIPPSIADPPLTPNKKAPQKRKRSQSSISSVSTNLDPEQ